jgi:hypothetical protein
MTGVANSVACSPLNALYYNVLQALCTTGIVASIKTWGLLTAACILIYVMTSAGARLCYSHAGDEKLPEDRECSRRATGGEAKLATRQPRTYHHLPSLLPRAPLHFPPLRSRQGGGGGRRPQRAARRGRQHQRPRQRGGRCAAAHVRPCRGLRIRRHQP